LLSPLTTSVFVFQREIWNAEEHNYRSILQREEEKERKRKQEKDKKNDGKDQPDEEEDPEEEEEEQEQEQRQAQRREETKKTPGTLSFQRKKENHKPPKYRSQSTISDWMVTKKSKIQDDSDEE
jgi:archaellum component FlaD/FlaE